MSVRHITMLRVTADGYAVVDEEGQKQHAKFKIGAVVGAAIAQNRSLPQQKFYWSVLKHVVESTGDYDTPEALHEALKIETDRVEVIKLMHNGRLVKVPRSTSFDAMPQAEFQAYVTEAFRKIEEHFLGGRSIDQFMTEADYRGPRPDMSVQEAAEQVDAPVAPEPGETPPEQPVDAAERYDWEARVNALLVEVAKLTHTTLATFIQEPRYQKFVAALVKSPHKDLVVRVRDAVQQADRREP